MKTNLDFKEVFKWVISPLIAKKLDIPANLDGQFLVNCIFSDQKEEQEVLDML